MAAGVLTLLSGNLMMLAGVVGHAARWATAGLITVPGGVVILAAFAVARRADRADGRPASGRQRAVPSAGAMIVTLAAGGMMVLAGYAGSAWGRVWSLPIAMAGGVTIAFAFALERNRTAS